MLFGRAVAVVSLVAGLTPAAVLTQELLLVEPIGRHLVRQDPDELAIEIDADPTCQIGSDMLTDAVVSVLRRGRLQKKERPSSGQDYFALRVALDCTKQAFLVEVDFVDRLPPESPRGPAGPLVRYVPGYRTFGLVESPQRTLAAAKRSVESAVNDYLQVNFKTQ
jgi:hypothetical protein